MLDPEDEELDGDHDPRNDEHHGHEEEQTDEGDPTEEVKEHAPDPLPVSSRMAVQSMSPVLVVPQFSHCRASWPSLRIGASRQRHGPRSMRIVLRA